MWAARCIHEASLYDDNCFITLTYHQEKLPEGETLVLEHWQKFMKRLKSAVRYKHGKTKADGIRFFHCGEYGTINGRPHYHALLFNWDFSDRVLWQKKNGVNLYLSATLQELWPHGFCTVGDVTYESAAYTARYIMKKITGPVAELHYENIDQITGQIIQRKPEYITMSRNPGIGHNWYHRFKNEIWPDDFIVVKGRKTRIPKYYDNQFAIEHPDTHWDNPEVAKIKSSRKRKGLKHKDNNTPERLKVRETVLKARIQHLKREIE